MLLFKKLKQNNRKKMINNTIDVSKSVKMNPV